MWRNVPLPSDICMYPHTMRHARTHAATLCGGFAQYDEGELFCHVTGSPFPSAEVIAAIVRAGVQGQ
jgi:hypothetical protein